MGQPLSEEDMRLFGLSEREIEQSHTVRMYIYGVGLGATALFAFYALLF